VNLSDRYRRLLVAWVGLVRRTAVATLVVAALVTGALVYYTATHIGINTSTTDMLDEGLPFRQALIREDTAFPQRDNLMVVVVDADSGDAASSAARALTDWAQSRTDLFSSVFYPASEAFFRRHGLLYLSRDELADLTDRLADAQPFLATLAGDPSLRGLADVLTTALEAAAKGEVTGRQQVAHLSLMLGETADTVESAAEGMPHDLAWADIIGGSAFGTSVGGSTRQIILLQPRLDFGKLVPGRAAMEAIHAEADAQGLTADQGVTVRLTGSAALASEELESVQQGMGWVGLVSFLLVAALLWIGLRSVRLAVYLVVTLVCGLVWTAGFATAVIGYLNLISVAFAVLFIGLGVDYGLHLVLRFREENARLNDPAAAMAAAISTIGPALSLCALTGIISFFSFLPTAYDGLSELGLISGVGLVIGLFANLTVTVALVALWPPPVAKAERRAAPSPSTPPTTGGRASFVERHAFGIVAAALITGAASLPIVAELRFDSDPMNLRDPDTESVQAFRDLMADEETRDDRAVVLAESLEAANRLAQKVDQLDVVAKTVTLSDYVPKDQQAKLAGIETAGLLLLPVLMAPQQPAEVAPEDLRRALASLLGPLEQVIAAPDAAAELATAAVDLKKSIGAFLAIDPDDGRIRALDRALVGRLVSRLDDLALALEAEPVTVDDLPETLRDRMVASDGTARLEIYPKRDVRDPDARREFVTAIQEITPYVTGTPATIMAAGDAVVRAILQAALYAAIGIVIILVISLRSIIATVLVLVPLGLAALLTGATAVAIGMPLNFANVIVLPLLFGLGVDSGIHIVMRSREHRAGASALGGTSTPRAVVFSGLTTIGSFCSLSISSHVGTSSMGILLTLTLLWTLVCTLIVLPALLVLVQRRRPTAVAAHPAMESEAR